MTVGELIETGDLHGVGRQGPTGELQHTVALGPHAAQDE